MKKKIFMAIMGVILLKILHNQQTLDRHIYESQRSWGLSEDDLIENNTIIGKTRNFILNRITEKENSK